MALLRVAIVDDEPLARQILREEFELLPDLEIVGLAASGPEALALTRAQAPDALFLDLEMPGMNGLEVIRQLHLAGLTPAIVIVTAYDRYAIPALELGAIDYLLKPVSPDRAAQAIRRIRSFVGLLAAPADPADPPGAPPRKIVGRAGDEYFLLSADEVFAFQAEGDLVWILTARKKLLATQTLRALELRLAQTNFRRIHRGALVNLDHVRKMSSLSSQRWLVTLHNNVEFVVSKRQARTVRELLT